MIKSRSDCCFPMTKSEKDDEHVFQEKFFISSCLHKRAYCEALIPT